MDVAAQLLDLCVLHLVEGGLFLTAQAPLKLVAVPSRYAKHRQFLLLAE